MAAMAANIITSPSSESVSDGSQTPDVPRLDRDAVDDRPRLKGHRRVLQKLQRMTSSPSLAKLRQTSSSAYRGTGKGSISCISLHAADPLVPQHGPRLVNGYATAPTSIPVTPGTETPSGEPRIRFAQHRLPPPPTSAPLPADVKAASRPGTSAGKVEQEQDYFAAAAAATGTTAEEKPTHKKKKKPTHDLWAPVPAEIKMRILQLLGPKEIVRCSAISKGWHKMCFDGQLWANLDTADFYKDIPAQGLVKIITYAGPFVRDLNLRGCIQLWECWRRTGLSDACRNLENVSLEDCRIDRGSVHSILYQNNKLVRINLSGLQNVNNSTLKIISEWCPKLEFLNISWCQQVDNVGLRKIVNNCRGLRDLRVGEMNGMDDLELMAELFKRNTLERLILMACESFNDEALRVLIEGVDNETDYLTGRKIVPPRKLKHLDLARCRQISNAGLMCLVGNVPYLEGLQLSKCRSLTDNSITELLPTLPRLTHLDLDELEHVTNASMQELARSPCRTTLQHLNVGYCEQIGDVGMLPVVKACTNIRSLDLDNTRISDLVLAEAAAMVRKRSSLRSTRKRNRRSYVVSPLTPGAVPENSNPAKPKIGLRLVCYDCQNVTWQGIREVLSRNAEIRRPAPFTFRLSSPPTVQPGPHSPANWTPPGSPNPSNRPPSISIANTPTSPSFALNPLAPQPGDPSTDMSIPHDSPPSYPHQIISLKVFYGYQPTVTEHTKRVLRGDLASASRLERKWACYMQASEEAGAAMGVGNGTGNGHGGGALMGMGVGGVFGAGRDMGNGVAGAINRRRRRRVREAMMMRADEEEGLGAWGGMVAGRRRRARSGGASTAGCTVM